MDNKKLNIEDFPEKQVIRIEGINYAYEFLRTWGQGGLPIGAILEIKARDDDTVTVERRIELEAYPTKPLVDISDAKFCKACGRASYA